MTGPTCFVFKNGNVWKIVMVQVFIRPTASSSPSSAFRPPPPILVVNSVGLSFQKRLKFCNILLHSKPKNLRLCKPQAMQDFSSNFVFLTSKLFLAQRVVSVTRKVRSFIFTTILVSEDLVPWESPGPKRANMSLSDKGSRA